MTVWRDWLIIISDIIKSSLLVDTDKVTMNDILIWIEERKKKAFVNIEKKPLSDLQKWNFTRENGIFHESGKFFSIKGFKASVKINNNFEQHWLQPIIVQPEIGFLGILSKRFDGILYFLMQAKIEPGNLNYIQISPTLQATQSNFTKVHKGKTPKFLEYFLGKKKNILVDQLQSEQGSRFFNKRNRNIIILTENDVPEDPDYCWMTLGQIKKLLEYNNVVNMDTRSVISLLPIVQKEKIIKDHYKTDSMNLYSDDIILARNNAAEIHSWLAERKMFIDKKHEYLPLDELDNYVMDNISIYDREGRFFSVIGCRIEVGNREVFNWDQPVIKSERKGLFCFFMKKINCVFHFLVQAVIEPGLIDIIEMGPTIQMSSDQNCNNFYMEYLNEGKYKIIHDSMQSEEGGRFYHEENRNMIIEVPEEFNENVKEEFMWITIEQLNYFSQFTNMLNIQARSLLSLINF